MTWHPHFRDLRGQTFAEWLASLPAAPPIPTSIVLASEERSGSEWLCQLMDVY